MKRLRKAYDNIIYSEYGYTMSLVVGLALFILFVFITEVNFTFHLKSMGIINITYFLEFANIVVFILIVNVCHRVVIRSNRTRIVIYSIFFALGAGINFIAFTNTNWLQGNIDVNNLALVTSFSRLVVIVGIFLGVVVHADKKIKFYNPLMSNVVQYSLAIVAIFATLNLSAIVLKIPDTFFEGHIYIFIEYISSFILVLSLAFNYKHYLDTKNKYVLMFTNGLIILVLSQIVRLIFINSTYLSDFVYELYSFMGYLTLYNALFAYNILDPLQDLMKDEKQIKLYADNLELIVDRRTTEMQNYNLRLIQEIEYAKNIQQSLLPPRRLNFKKVVFISEYFPCERLSGDFFDIYRLDDSNIGMYVLDVSGHGVSAALMTMFCNNFIRSSEKLIMKYRGLKPSRNLKHFYEEFNKMKFPDEMYMVMFFASYNVDTGLLTYSSGGINCYPMVMKADGTKIFLDQSQGFPICKMSAFFTPKYTSESLLLTKGDRVIFYTDGLVDNTKNVTITQAQLEDLMYEYRELSLKLLNNKIKSFINPEQGINEDDITYFIMEI